MALCGWCRQYYADHFHFPEPFPSTKLHVRQSGNPGQLLNFALWNWTRDHLASRWPYKPLLYWVSSWQASLDINNASLDINNESLDINNNNNVDINNNSNVDYNDSNVNINNSNLVETFPVKDIAVHIFWFLVTTQIWSLGLSVLCWWQVA